MSSTYVVTSNEGDETSIFADEMVVDEGILYARQSGIQIGAFRDWSHYGRVPSNPVEANVHAALALRKATELHLEAIQRLNKAADEFRASREESR
ncbi:hypothetical protein BN970_07152 [Mycolicibacterium conceptionense]|uniref:Uncharacterized protein n=2 Tax=Mycolicibacterium conceptionense TaxID=451644 RepID=A0A0U1E286_9MYCO|nr:MULTISPECIES: hypothetical protein [Mycolicibacterium]CQD15751.1 hypothetical protein BN970_03313 [Mycolicibacterium conceptionense]CQD25350.1 hypothetical protein BN970_07152 [Mycolicibacterium conceptionense]